MSQKPLLIFPTPGKVSRTTGSGFPSNLKFPSPQSQSTRLGTRMSNIEQVFKNQTANFHSSIDGQFPEMILVFEIVGTIDNFFGAIKKTEGMEYLGEQHIDDAEPDEFFFKIDEHGNQIAKEIERRIFLSLTNEKAIQELLRYWKVFKTGAKVELDHGKGKYVHLFNQLRDIRPYSIQDRIKDTGLENYLADLRQDGESQIHFEIELTYKEGDENNEATFNQIKSLLELSEGYVIENSKIILPEIRYFGCIAVAPIQVFDELTEETSVQFLKSEKILFFRPVGQTVSKTNIKEESTGSNIDEEQEVLTYKYPVAALLDGFPLANHTLLENKLIIDDPDEVEVGYLSAYRHHGTEMASIIIHGDLDDKSQNQLPYPLYVHPLMLLDGFSGNYFERISKEKLPLDLIHRAVKRIFEGEGDEKPTAPTIKIINLSIGDSYRPFQYNLSGWAKLIDWLSEKYNVLFIISAGNYDGDISLELNEATFVRLSDKEKKEEIIKAILSENYKRKILTPAESINSITVGACHDDASIGNQYPNYRTELIGHPEMMSLVSRIGLGFSSSLKPEILMPGGRKLFRKGILPSSTDRITFTLEQNSHNPNPPGIKVAFPGNKSLLNETTYTCGTSNATALATRLGVQIYEVLKKLNSAFTGREKIPEDFFTVLIKSLLVHGASRGQIFDSFKEVMQQHNGISNNSIKKHAGAFLGYGKVNAQKVLNCTEQRVTLLGFGELTKDKAHEFRFPLPNSITGQTIDKKLTITLSWMTPINCQSGKYKQAALFFDNVESNQNDITFDRNEYDFKHGKKGTVQHDSLYGSKADAYIDGSDLIVKVNCKQIALGLKADYRIKYGLAVTLELLENNVINIYDEIKNRIKQRIQVEN